MATACTAAVGSTAAVIRASAPRSSSAAAAVPARAASALTHQRHAPIPTSSRQARLSQRTPRARRVPTHAAAAAGSAADAAADAR
jgi:hypothetical protein